MNVSFIHRGGAGMASYRYRAMLPAHHLGARINDTSADVLVYAKPAPEEVDEAVAAKDAGKAIVVDFCDDHFATQPHYMQMADLADAVTCPTTTMMAQIMAAGYKGEVTVIFDPYEFPEVMPHCAGANLLWFGHGSNFNSLVRVLPRIFAPLVAVSNIPLARPWSMETMYREFLSADIVILPATAPHKSANRAIESIRQGCFVVAEPHPSLTELPGIWIGDIPEGIAWAIQNPSQANERTREAQNYVSTRFSPRTQASAWKSLLQRVKSACTSAAATSTGRSGSTSTLTASAPT